LWPDGWLDSGIFRRRMVLGVEGREATLPDMLRNDLEIEAK
jgi:hypothetical protein